MDLRLNSIQTGMVNANSLQRSLASERRAEQAGFGDSLRNALQAVSEAQLKAQGMQREVQMENPTVSIEETMVAMQKSQIGFQATLHVRNRLVQAYSDIMNMQV